MSDYFLGEIRIFAGNYAPSDWAKCYGTSMPISTNESLYTLLGLTFGGNGTTNFFLPDMRGRLPIHYGTGIGLSERPLGAMIGAETVTLTAATLPAHTHAMNALNVPVNTNVPQGNMLGAVAAPYSLYEDLNSGATLYGMAANAVGLSGSSVPHDNIMPCLTLTFMICVNGVYPARNN
jgi:microcystin-dependent protein